MELYGLKNCDTCRKALKALQNAGNEVVLRDVRAEGMADTLRDRALAEFGDKLLNTRSTTWRGLSEEERAKAPEVLLAEHPALMKRPLIVVGDNLYLGWDKTVQGALLQED
ncbi:ArsC/Spx/MgsR family protein [Alisedimentitalea sp. MJ-SS2]|uniref:ArsC/Spx/MgsR family protein n=1 Tax=Aliisedimentitalea sp. MJ-SS2 TaxID=3049795 RepID=UPI00290D78F4|nr:ArsC/Spx/MgsR family protein [Alisedimentitalea sp. MJ-SS2]MDU8926346.1 ArsC/Spx/MgsR family protein [Alisedimentitalea sp. MJ-SS2]